MSEFIGQLAPNFAIADQNGKIHQLSDYAGKYLLIYFYPKDMTSGCTLEAQNFRDKLTAFQELNCAVLGVSIDDCAKHQKFIEKESLNFDLLADTDKKMVSDFGVWVEKSMYGRKYMGIQRDSFLINPDGLVIKHYSKVKPANHANEVLADLKKLQSV